MNLLLQVKTELSRSNADKKHPFRYFSLSTFGEYPEIRMVVSRKIEQDLSILFYTDTRTPKVEQIKKNNKVIALFYHPKKRLQIRLKGEAQLIQKGHPSFETHLAQVQQSPSLKDYTTLLPPSSPLLDAEIKYGSHLHFTAIIIQPVLLDILLLQRKGHLRHTYEKTEEEWVMNRLVP